VESRGNSHHESVGAGGRRTTAEVLRDHLELRAKAELERDIERNYHPKFVLLHVNGVEHGHAGMRRSGRRLQQQMPGIRFEVVSLQIDGEYAYLEWRARSDHHVVSDGADSFVVRDGKILMQTIHYTLQEPDQRYPSDTPGPP
jgi:hypothetical protein